MEGGGGAGSSLMTVQTQEGIFTHALVITHTGLYNYM